MRSPVMQPSSITKQAYTSTAYSGISSSSPFLSKSSVGTGIDLSKQYTGTAYSGISSSRPFVSTSSYGTGMDLKASGQVVSERPVSRQEMASGGNLIEGPDETRQRYGQRSYSPGYREYIEDVGVRRSAVPTQLGRSGVSGSIVSTVGSVARSYGDATRFASGAASFEYSSAVPRSFEQSSFIGSQRTYEPSSLIGGRSSSAVARSISPQPRSAYSYQGVDDFRTVSTSTSFPTRGSFPMQVGYGSAPLSTYGGGMTMI